MSKKTSSDKKIFPEDMGFDEALNRLARVKPEDLSSTPPHGSKQKEEQNPSSNGQEEKDNS